MKNLMSGIEQGVLLLNIKRLLDHAETSIDNARLSVPSRPEDLDRYIRISDAYVRIATAKIQQLYTVQDEPTAQNEPTVQNEPVVSKSSEEPLMTTEQAQQKLRIGRTSFFGLLKSGQIDSIKIGKNRRVLRSSVDDFVERLMEEQTDPYVAEKE